MLVLELVERRIDDVLAVDVADAGAADRAHEGHAADRERGRRGDHRHDVGIVLEVVRQRGHDDQRLVAIALVEQRTDRTVDQARGQDLLLGGPAFTLEEAARDLAGGESLLLVVHGQREEIEAGLRLLLEHDGGQHRGAAIGRQHRAIGLARDLAGLEHELAAGPFDFLAEHLNISLISIFLSYTAFAPVWRRPPAGALAPAGPGQAFALAPAFPVTAKSRRPAEFLREPDDATRKGPAETTGP